MRSLKLLRLRYHLGHRRTVGEETGIVRSEFYDRFRE